MATRYAVATGNWSDVTTWDGGASLPGVGDDVYANGFDVSIDQDIEVNKISTEVCPITLVSGGGFINTKTGTHILTCNIVAGTTRCLLTSTIASILLYLIGDIYGGSAASAYGVYLNCTTNGAPGSSPIIIGNIYGGSSANAYGLAARTDRSYSPNITGNVVAGIGASAIKIKTSSIAFLLLVGNVTAEIGFPAVSIPATNLSLFVNASGIFTASSTSPAIYYGAGTAIISGQLVNNSGILAVLGDSISSKLFLNETGILCWQFNTAGVDRTLYTADVLENPPAESDTRSGVVYGIGNNYTGTLAVPPAESVVNNVPVDNTVGTYALSGDLITRLEKCATTEEVDSSIAAYNS